MDNIFNITDKSGRKIYLSKERWSHIRRKHPEVEESEIIEQTLINPDKINSNYTNETMNRYYKFFKWRELPRKYLLVSVKYLNGEGYVVSAYFDKNIK